MTKVLNTLIAGIIGLNVYGCVDGSNNNQLESAVINAVQQNAYATSNDTIENSFSELLALLNSNGSNVILKGDLKSMDALNLIV